MIESIVLQSNSTRQLSARVNADGDLELVGHEVIESQDLGDQESRYAGDLDYVLTVPANHKDTLLLNLVADRFDNETEFAAWLKSKGIAATLKG